MAMDMDMVRRVNKTDLAAMPAGAMFASGLVHRSSCLLAGIILAGTGLPVFAQSLESSGDGQASAAASSSGSSNGSGLATEIAQRMAWKVTPRVSVTETLTDNVDVGSANKQRDQITEISPGILMRGESARLKGHFDYQFRALAYAQNSKSNETQQSLNAFGTLEAIEKWLFVDASGMISQQSISAFGSQSASNSNLNNNRTETSSFQLSPYIRGRIGSFANYDVRYKHAATSSKSGLASDVNTDGLTANINGALGQSNFSWSMEGSLDRVDYSDGRTTENDRLRGVLSYKIDPRIMVSIIGGRESNDYTSLNKERHTNRGFALDWSPTERTRLTASKESRFFGDGHTLSFSHRTPLMAISYTNSKDVSVLPNQFAKFSLGTVYDLFYNQYASSIPDPIARAQKVNDLLQQTGLPANAVIEAGFLFSQATVERRQMLSMVLNGLRNVVTVSATQSEKQSLNAGTGLVDDFSLSPTIKQRGYNVNWAYRFSPLSSINFLASQQDSISPSAARLDTRQKTFNFNFMTKFGSRTTLMFGARRALFDNATSPYTENAMFGTASIQF